MKTRNTFLLTGLIASAVGLAAIPSFADAENGARNQPRQMAYNDGDRDDDRRGGPGHHGMRMGGGHGGPRGHGGPGGPHGPGDSAGGPRGGGMSEFLIERFDIDEDGTITAVEIATVNAERVSNYDADGNKALSLAEFKALWADTMNERIVREFQKLDPDGDASVTLEEYSKRFERMFSQLDLDGNDAIDQDELKGPRGGPGKGPGKGKGPGMGKGPGKGKGPGPANGPDAGGGPDAN